MKTCVFNSLKIEVISFFYEHFPNYESLKSALRLLVSKTILSQNLFLYYTTNLSHQ